MTTMFLVKHDSKTIEGTVNLTGSKSESNRALIIQAISKGLVQIENISNADDTEILQRVIQEAKNHSGEEPTVLDIGPAGTAMRFMTSYLNFLPGKFILTGTDRMKQRPIGALTDALKELGCNLKSTHKEGYPPLEISGPFIQKVNNLAIDGNISSQYISSLLLIAPYLPSGLDLKIKGELTSRPYVEMTLEMLQSTGIQYKWEDNHIHISPQEYKKSSWLVEPDWSAASYWYSILALSESGELYLPALKKESLQGDRQIAEIMELFGVKTEFIDQDKHGIRLTKITPKIQHEVIDFTTCPDIAQTVVVVAAALKKDIQITGLHTLRIKETDRIAALQNEIAKFGCKLLEKGNIFHLDTSGSFTPEGLTFETYEDHRMAMAFAPLALTFPEIKIKEPQVVDKSYPEFWKHLANVGFAIEEA